MVAPQNNNLAAAFPLAPRSLLQNLRWSKETTRESYLVRGTCGRGQGHAPLATHGKSGILRQLHFLLAGAAEVPRFIEQDGTSHTHHVVDGHTYGAKEVTKRRRNKAFSGRKPFTATRAAVSSTSSVWERRDALSPIA